MSNWFVDYHHAQLLRLLSMVIMFGVVWPSLCLLFVACSKLRTHIAERMTAKARMTRHQIS